MSAMKWKLRKVAGLVFLVPTIYFLLRIKSYDHKASIILKQTQPSKVWEFVADFSNMKTLNPTMLDFTILHESGNYEQWKYSVEYSERLSHWPHLYNSATAHFDIKAKSREIFYINSVHTTCVFMGYFCVDAKSEFRFSHINSTGALCEEDIQYQCPVFLASFCHREVAYQRHAIMKNLKQHFHSTQ